MFALEWWPREGAPTPPPTPGSASCVHQKHHMPDDTPYFPLSCPPSSPSSSPFLSFRSLPHLPLLSPSYIPSSLHPPGRPAKTRPIHKTKTGGLSVVTHHGGGGRGRWGVEREEEGEGKGWRGRERRERVASIGERGCYEQRRRGVKERRILGSGKVSERRRVREKERKKRKVEAAHEER